MKDIDRNINAQLYENLLFVKQNRNFIMSSIGLELDMYKKEIVHEFEYKAVNVGRRLIDTYTLDQGIYLIKHHYIADANAKGYSYINLRISTDPNYGNYGYIAASPVSPFESAYADNFTLIGTDKKITLDFIGIGITDPILLNSTITYYKLIEK